MRTTIDANKQIIHFLDVTFNVSNSTYQPFTKANTTLHKSLSKMLKPMFMFLSPLIFLGNYLAGLVHATCVGFIQNSSFVQFDTFTWASPPRSTACNNALPICICFKTIECNTVTAVTTFLLLVCNQCRLGTNLNATTGLQE